MDELTSENLENLTILLVDDDPFMRRALGRTLSDIGLSNIHLAENGREALEVLSKQQVDLLLTDIQMPEMNGLELLKTIRCGQGGVERDLRTIIITALTDIETLGLSIALDVNGFITKPFKPVLVIKAILKALSEEVTHIGDKNSYLSVSTDPGSSGPEVGLPEPNEGVTGDAKQAEPLSVYALQPEMCLAQNVITKAGVLLLKKGFVLNQSTINRLRDLEDVVESNSYYVE